MSYRKEFKDYIEQESRQEAKKLKEMSWSDRFWYLWEYYKWHMVIGCMVVFFIFAIVSSIYNMTVKTKLYCVVINNPNVYEENLRALSENFASYMQFGKKEKVIAESLHLPTDGTFDEVVMATQGKLSALIASESLDIMISDEPVFQKYAEMTGYQNLETVLPEDLMDLLQDRLIYAKDASGQTLPYAIDVTGNWLMKEMGVSTDPAYLSVIVNAHNTDTIVELLRYMFESR